MRYCNVDKYLQAIQEKLDEIKAIKQCDTIQAWGKVVDALDDISSYADECALEIESE